VFIYIAVIVFCWLLALSPKLTKSSRVQSLFAIALILFLCFGYMTGSDWRTYEKWYDWVDILSLFSGYSKEPGYYFYMLLFKVLHVSFWPFLIITKVIIFFLMFRCVQQLYPDNIFLFWMYFLPWFGFFVFIDNPLRNAIAVTIFLLSLKHLINRSFLKYMAFMLLAISFHFTAIIMLPLYYLANKRISNSILIIAYFLTNIVFAFHGIQMKFIELIFSNFPYIDQIITKYIDLNRTAVGTTFSFGLALHIMLFFLILSFRKSIENKITFGYYIFNLAILYPFFFRFGLTMQLATRFQLFLSVFFVIAIISIFKFFDSNLKVCYVIFLLFISLIACKNIMSYKYVPYSNYLQYVIINDYPSYEYRSSYNINNTPFR